MSTVFCAVCYYVPPPDKRLRVAVTIIEGYAVCEDHLGYVAQGQRFAAILNAAQRAAEVSQEGKER
jgi:hypothetical protein